MYPKYVQAAKSGEAGVHIVSNIVNQNFEWIFRRTHQEHDFGIDGYIDYVTLDGGVTGQFFACQIKHGISFFKEKKISGYTYRGDHKHFNFLCNQPTTVLIIICHPKSHDCYWTVFDKTDCIIHENSWTTIIPFSNKLAASKESLTRLFPSAPNHLHHTSQAGMLSSFLDNGSHIIFSIDRKDVENMSVRSIRNFFDHLRSSKQLAKRAQGRVEITFNGYDDDKRELFEIPEVRQYIPLLDAALPEIFFFAWSHEQASTIRTLVFCQTRIINKKIISPSGRYRIEIDSEFVSQFMTRHWPGLNEMTEWLEISENDNKEICYRLLKKVNEELTREEFEMATGA